MKTKQKTRIKVCGICRPEEIELAALYGADAVGFITEVPVETPRKLNIETAASLVSNVPSTLNSVLVIMPQNSTEALDLIGQVKPDIVQIHSPLSLLELEIIKQNTDIPIIKVLSLPAKEKTSSQKTKNPNLIFDLLEEVRLLEEADVVDSILLDTGKSGRTGGTGSIHDWALSKQIAQETELPLILAGGLNPENVKEAIETVSPYAVDTASGVETAGKKDAIKIKTFIEEVRCANAFL
ncbi:MAG: phosphoribosylanthranilate isomerase [Methanosarcina sp.]